MYTKEDLTQLKSKNIGTEVIEKQLAYFRSGFPFLRLDRAATAGDGIRKLSVSETERLEKSFVSGLTQRKVSKFVPASGAATRMFKDLYEFIQSTDDVEHASIKEIFDRLPDFAFYGSLKEVMDKRQVKVSDRKKVAALILLTEGLNYGNLPKGMLQFHKYEDGVRTALEEHLAEGALYACNADGDVVIHFTVSPEHQAGFESLVKDRCKRYAQLFGVTYHISFSQQKPSTDTMAVGLDNAPIRNSDGSLLFRPGGHGALLENLNDLDSDIIFIKNIDNVVSDRLKAPTITYKKALGGLLVQLQDEAFSLVRALRSNPDSITIQKAASFLLEQLSFEAPADMSGWSSERRVTYLLSVLNRPIRVCGMVRNEGEPGGGPFWVRNTDGSASLQIAESSQIDMGQSQQKAMAANATHFNPVDLVCAVRDCDGKHYDLLQYRDPDTGFISEKSKDGVKLKAQELPGLWNGAMANWNTVFVEVPIETFNPVKTINDLLRPQHQ